MTDGKAETYLECERKRVYFLLMFTAGFYGAFTYSIRGGVFCNAQTGNFVLLAMALGSADWTKALYLLLPINAYMLGAVISELLPISEKRPNGLRWETELIMFEMLVVIFLGLIPETAPVQIAQVCINFICSMQYNTFRQSQDVPMATTFCTNHIRQTGVQLSLLIRDHGNKKARVRLWTHIGMISVFIAGGIVSTVLCNWLLGKAIFFALIPLAILLIDFLHADLVSQKDRLKEPPAGH